MWNYNDIVPIGRFPFAAGEYHFERSEKYHMPKAFIIPEGYIMVLVSLGVIFDLVNTVQANETYNMISLLRRYDSSRRLEMIYFATLI